ncbi:restriction endonuclease [Candidatus Mycolicibacterium alkanivorans]|uniref:Restriction endonuclease n=1 Tax=Candidatus Mycolicibacterium alkanivorans TaxID=2954114 RepID=A0ABS9YX13_9MYCO|nr:restriction endonuclease [Candidatus Mycolicibacterium alkanivorans]MCI4675764.1 restriction endonuclease [Candidatus Mycolicibacterium alkanivorans]
MREESTAFTTALQWLALWLAATALLALGGLLNRAVWVLAAAAAVLTVVAAWRALLAYLNHRRNLRLEALYRSSGQAAVDSMTGVEFEHYVAAVLRGRGYSVEFTRATGDFGVDLIATRNGVRTAVQCKRQARAVNGAAIQQVVAGAAVHDCTATMVVSNHRYTSAAQHLAEVHNCVLVDRTRLARLARTPVQPTKRSRGCSAVRQF